MRTLTIVATAFLVGVAGCSGSRSFAPATNATSAPLSGSRATLTVIVPRPSSQANARKHPLYVSPSSTVLDVAVNGGVASTYGLTPNSPGCIVQDANLTCTFAIVAPPGRDTLAIALADGSGHVLSHNIVTANVAAGVSTPVSITLAGVPASVAIVPGANALVDTFTAPIHAAGLDPQPIEVEALDADGNVIVGPGSPTIGSVTVSSGGAFAKVASAQTNDPAAFVLSPVDGSAGGKTVTVSATVRGLPLSDGTTSPALSGTTTYLFTPAIAIGDGVQAKIYSVETGQEVAAVAACTGGCATTIINSLGSDANGDLYLTYSSFLGISSSSTLEGFPPGAPVPAYTLGSSNGIHSLVDIAVDTHAIVYAANGNTGSFGHPRQMPAITEYAFGATTPQYTIAGTADQPGGISVDPTGNVFLSDPNDTISIAKYPPKSQTASATLSDPSILEPTYMVNDARGDLYVTDQMNNDIPYFAAKQTALTTTISDSSFGGGIDFLMMDPLGNLWVSLGSNGTVERLDGASLPNTVVITDTIAAGGPMAWIP